MDSSGLIFPGMRARRPVSENTNAKLVRELGFDAVTYGSLSSSCDYAAEQTKAVVEAVLAHTLTNKPEESYPCSDLFDTLCALMGSWTAYLAE